MSVTIDDPRMARDDADLSERWRCCWTTGRERCHYPGSISPDTRGSSRWFCAAHFRCADGAEGAQIVEESRGFVRGTPRGYPPRPFPEDATDGR
jgi:hypothetical protein